MRLLVEWCFTHGSTHGPLTLRWHEEFFTRRQESFFEPEPKRHFLELCSLPIEDVSKGSLSQTRAVLDGAEQRLHRGLTSMGEETGGCHLPCVGALRNSMGRSAELRLHGKARVKFDDGGKGGMALNAMRRGGRAVKLYP